MKIQARLPEEVQDAVGERVDRAISERVAQRIWRGDPSLWGGPGVPEIEDRLGWLTVSEAMLGHVGEVRAFADEARAEGFRDAVLLGMGGSSLGPEVISQSFGAAAAADAAAGGELARGAPAVGEVARGAPAGASGGLRLQVLDSTHPDQILSVQESVDLERTLFIVSSKSGGTIETLSHYRHFKTLAAPSQFVVITDPGSPLERLAADDGLRRTFLNPPDIGGRYSVLSLFGLVPAAVMGVDIEALLRSAQVGEQDCAQDSSESSSGLWLGAAVGEMARQGRDKLTFFVSPPIESFGLWVEQLVAESTGKHGRGILPVADEPLGEAGVYGDDRVFVYLRGAGRDQKVPHRGTNRPDRAAADAAHDPAIAAPADEALDPAIAPPADEALDRAIADRDGETLDRAVEALAAAGHPTLTMATHGPDDLGRIFFLSEFAVAVAGWALEINPFDQPNVQEAKDKTAQVLASGRIPEIEPADDQALRALLADARPPHYVAILGYLPYSSELDAAIAALRATIRQATGAAVTFGYGPRFQHSTGQEHKGGPPTGHFLQLINNPQRDVAIPGESYTFAGLIAAQAAADLQTLRAYGLPAERVSLGSGDPASAVRALTERIEALLQ